MMMTQQHQTQIESDDEFVAAVNKRMKALRDATEGAGNGTNENLREIVDARARVMQHAEKDIRGLLKVIERRAIQKEAAAVAENVSAVEEKQSAITICTPVHEVLRLANPQTLTISYIFRTLEGVYYVPSGSKFADSLNRHHRTPHDRYANGQTYELTVGNRNDVLRISHHEPKEKA